MLNKFKKNNTIRIRITLYAMIIMVCIIFISVFSVYFLQSISTSVGYFGPKELQYVEVSVADVEMAKSTDELIKMFEVRVKEQQQLLFIRLVIISTLTLVVSGIVIYLITRKELKPLEKLQDEVEKVDFTNKKNHVQIESDREEIVALADAFNVMLKKLNASYQMQKRFAQNAAHELKTPITTLMTSIQVARMTKKDPQEIYDNLEDQVTRMSQLTNELLTLNKRQTLDLKLVDLKKLVEHKLVNLEGMVAAKNVSIQVIGDAEILTDSGLLGLVINNLIENAVKYNVDGGTINITIKPDCLIIEDSGIGIDNCELQNIFTPFYCIDDSRSKALGGFGLGLSIVRETLDTLGYECSVTSEISKGTSIVIYFKNNIVNRK